MRLALAIGFFIIIAAMVLAVATSAHANTCCVGGWVLIDGKWIWESCRFVVNC